MDLNAALKWLSTAVINTVGHSLKEPDLVILRGTWRGLTYEQMADSSDYSTNYLMRDVAPKLWKQLSNVFGRSVGKTNFRVALESYVATHSSDIEFELAAASPTASTYTADLNRAPLKNPTETGLYRHPSVLTSSFPETIRSELNTRKEPLTHSPMPASAVEMYGYEAELAQVKQWIAPIFRHQNADLNRAAPLTHQSVSGQVVGIWGLKGVGKTLLAEKVVVQVSDRFDATVWRSLQNQPSLDELSASILSSLGIHASAQAAAQLRSLMTQRSLLIVLEDLEAILQPNALAGSYAPQHQDYEKFFQAVMGSRSCIILTGIEGPTAYIHSSEHSGVRAMTLTQLSETAATQLLQTELSVTPTSPVQTSEAGAAEIGFPEDFSPILNTLPQTLPQALSQTPPQTTPQTTPQTLSQKSQPSALTPSADALHWPALINRYQGHPLAIKSACRVIQTLFSGQIQTFLQQTSILLTDIQRLLAPSFSRLTTPEKDVLFWLASQDSPSFSLTELQASPLLINSVELIAVLDSLKQRSLLNVSSVINSETTPPTFEIPPLVRAYAIQQLIGQFAEQANSYSAPIIQRPVQSFSTQTIHFTEPVIHLGQSPAEPTQLSQWMEGHFQPSWQSLNKLFQGSTHPAIRLRSTYYLQSSNLVKRYRLIALNAKHSTLKALKSERSVITTDTAIATSAASHAATAAQNINVILIVAIHPEPQSKYMLHVQTQPAQEGITLPTSFSLNLLDAKQTLLATVAAQQDDAFIQLPSFQGTLAESFSVELALDELTHTETFLI